MARTRSPRSSFALLVGFVVAAFVGNDARTAEPAGRDSRLFHLDTAGRRILGPARHLPPWLSLQLASATMDQPQYWPDEKVHLSILMPGRAGTSVKIAWNKRDATPREQTVALDADGVAVVVLMDGTAPAQRLELGEYRADVATADGKLKAHATFAVVEGTLGALSLGFEMRQVTSIAALDAAKGGWFLGNAGGAGSRWGNGLSFKNQLRVDNEPFTGEVQLVPRCMLAGCNGIVAGPQQRLQVKNGEIAATLAVGGHSGPFQVEFVTPSGSLRHQFDGSGHVEREMHAVSGGVGLNHRIGLAPYEGTVQVPGRQVFVERGKTTNAQDAFVIEDIVATGGRLQVKVAKALTGARAFVWQPQPDGTYLPQDAKIAVNLKAGEVLQLAVAPPMAFVTLAGFEAGKGGKGADVLREGWAIAFPPASWTVVLTLPQSGEPLASVPVTIEVKGLDGQGVAASGVLEVYDNRVAAAPPAGQLASAIGDSVRSTSRQVSSWVDPIELERQRKLEEQQAIAEEKQRKKEEAEERKQERKERQMLREDSAKKNMMFGDTRSGGMGMRGYGSGGGGGGVGVSMGSMKLMAASPAPGSAAHAGHADEGETEAGGEQVREGEKKVVFCGLVRTGADGRVTVQVDLPPQTGRVTARFVAVHGLDWTSAQRDMDITRKAWVEAKLPRMFVPGAKLDVRTVVVNQTAGPLRLQVSGAGIDGTFTREIAVGRQEVTVPWQGKESGKVVLQLLDANGKVRDRRESVVQALGEQAVTWSRLEFGGHRPVPVQAGETAVVFAGPGPLLKGIVGNLVTATYSWFPHAEALSARIAIRATVLDAIARNLLDDEGLSAAMRADLARDVRDLRERFFDAGSSQFRPWPGLPPSPRWTAWVNRNLHAARRHLQQPQLRGPMADSVRVLEDTVKAVDAGFKARNEDPRQLAGYDPDQAGLEVVPIEIDGKVVWNVVTDSAVQQFVIDKLAPQLDPDAADAELAMGKALDTFRFLRAFERVGRLQLLMESAKAAWLAGPKGREAFDRLYATIARGLVLAQEPGVVQGPALLGGVYSAPMAVVRFLELTMMAAERKATAAGAAFKTSSTRTALQFGQRITAESAGTLDLPDGAIARIDRRSQVSLTEGKAAPWLSADVKDHDLQVAGTTELVIELAASKDPLEYYALVAVPTTTAIRQTEDALSDYKGQLIYGQQGTGGGKMQVIAVPFRGARRMSLWLEGLLPGASPGFVLVRHLQKPDETALVRLAEVRVRAATSQAGRAP